MTAEELKTAMDIYDWCSENKVKYISSLYRYAYRYHPDEWVPVIRRIRRMMLEYFESVRHKIREFNDNGEIV